MTLPETVTKVRRLRDGRLFAWTGKIGLGERVFAAMNKRMAPPKMGEGEGCAIVVDTKGRIFTYEDDALIRTYGHYTARGSGKEYAFGALAMGATAVEAIKVARSLDHGTSGRIRTVTLRG